MALAFVLGLNIFLGSTPLSAQESPEESIILGEDAPALPAQGPAPVPVILRMVLVLALAALAIYGVVFFIKRLSRPPQSRDPHLRVLARTPLGPGAYAAVVSVGSKAWLVGGGDGGVSLLAEIEEQEAVAAMLADDARKAGEAPLRFGDFKTLLRRLGGAPAGDSLTGYHAESLRNKGERLKRFKP
ncbi:MAG: flagellar biosynthetic protein FliO [Treponema sp.]|nr:flagellar biosynthetic protein FliO [Treponema sp.]